MSDRRSRREFMGLTAAGIGGVLARPWLESGVVAAAVAPTVQRAPTADPDLIVINAKVYTMDPAMPRAEAFATSGGRILAVGSTADVRALARRRATTFDAKGMTIVPGFV